MAVRIFRHYVSQAAIALAAAEALIFVFSVYAGVSIRLWEGEATPRMLVGSLLPKGLLFAAVMMLALTATGLYQRGLRERIGGIALRAAVAFGLGGLGMGVIFAIMPSMYMGPDAFVVAMATALLGIAASRLLFYSVADHDVLKKRVLVLGAGQEAHEIAMLRRRTDRRGIKILGYVHLRNEKDVIDPALIIRSNRPLPELARSLSVDEIVIAADDRHKSFPFEDVIECKMSGITVIDRVSFYERQLGKINIDLLRPSDIIFLDGFSHAVLKSYSKRAFDIFASSLLLGLASPVILLAAAAVYLESGGRDPIFYRQDRVGRNGRIFPVIKFRSMRVDAEKHGAQWARKNDPRVTAIGGFLRKTRIDELPQLFNVFRGDMSFVGPRPERPQFVEELTTQIPYFAMRHRVNPGITGWAQVSYPYGASLRDAKEKLQYDLYYIKNYSLFLDLTIIFQTIQVVLWGQGAR